MLTRRHFLLGTGAVVASACARNAPLPTTSDGPVEVNDVHSQLNPTRVHRIVQPTSVEDVRRAMRQARREGRAVSIAGGRHAMGGQQFGTDTLLLDMRGMRRVLALDAEAGVVDVEPGIEWPELIDQLIRMQQGRARQWGIVQKQTWACTVLNLHVVHSPEGLARGAAAFRRLIDHAIRRRGSYFLTYHHWATRAQVEACYPQFAEWLGQKRRFDPEERFQSDWYRHYRAMFA